MVRVFALSDRKRSNIVIFSFSNYGGVPVKAEYCHESVCQLDQGLSTVFESRLPQALRLVLHSISTAASRYGRYIEPLLSLSIDFYVRVFVRIKTAPLEVKKAVTYALHSASSALVNQLIYSKTSNYYVCSSCQTFYGQPLGKLTETTHGASGNVNYLFKIQSGPPVGAKCAECDSSLHVSCHCICC